MCSRDFYLAFLWNRAVKLIIPHVKNVDRSFGLFSRTRRSTYSPTSTTLQSSNWRLRCTYRNSDLLCTPVDSASKPGVTELGFLALTSNGENEYVLTNKKGDAARVPCTGPFKDEEHCRSLGQGEPAIGDDPVLFGAGSGEVRWDHIFKFHMASGWPRRFSAFSLQEWIWTLVQRKGKIWKWPVFLLTGPKPWLKPQATALIKVFPFASDTQSPAFVLVLRTRFSPLSLFHSSCRVISHLLTADTFPWDWLQLLLRSFWFCLLPIPHFCAVFQPSHSP